jgi:AcrR family transcriptional regulator
MTTTKARRGRTPSVTPDKLTDAVRRVSANEGLSMAAVAGELGVDVTTLYRHVGGLDALRQIGAEVTAPTVGEWPSSDGLSWREWLGALAHYYRGALHRNPDLVEFAHTAIDPDFERFAHATRTLTDFGFETRAAGFAHGFLINTVVGYVAGELREAELIARGESSLSRYVRALEGDRDSDRITTLRQLDLTPSDFDPDSAFERFLRYAIDGIGAQPGVPA